MYPWLFMFSPRALSSACVNGECPDPSDTGWSSPAVKILIDFLSNKS